MKDFTEEELRAFESAKCLPPDMAEATDFEAEEAIEIDKSIKLPASYSLGKWIYKTSNQGSLWSCTAMWTSHGVQILNVKKEWTVPTTKNIITPSWKDLWSKMWHSTTQYDGWDYVERAINVALKQWILIEENWKLAKFDAYATSEYNSDDASIEMMKRYLYKGCPIVRLIRWNIDTWTQMKEWEIKTVPSSMTWWHCIALVGWDETGLWFINSWKPNDWKGLKSRFHITYSMMKKLRGKFNYRYRILYVKEDAKTDPEYLKRKNMYVNILTILKKYYPEESSAVKKWIEAFSSAVRAKYEEINEELPK